MYIHATSYQSKASNIVQLVLGRKVTDGLLICGDLKAGPHRGLFRMKYPEQETKKKKVSKRGQQVSPAKCCLPAYPLNMSIP